MSAERLKSYIDRIERLRAEKRTIAEDERDLFTEAKSSGYDTKALRRVLQRRAMDPSERQTLDDLVDAYEVALGVKAEAARMVAQGATVREAAKATGLSVGSVSAAARVQKTRIIEQPTVQKTQEIEQADMPPMPDFLDKRASA